MSSCNIYTILYILLLNVHGLMKIDSTAIFNRNYCLLLYIILYYVCDLTFNFRIESRILFRRKKTEIERQTRLGYNKICRRDLRRLKIDVLRIIYKVIKSVRTAYMVKRSTIMLSAIIL